MYYKSGLSGKRQATRWYSRRVRLNQDGYVPGGSYWGSGKSLYYCHSCDYNLDFYIRGDKSYAESACNFVRRCSDPEHACRNINATGKF